MTSIDDNEDLEFTHEAFKVQTWHKIIMNLWLLFFLYAWLSFWLTRIFSLTFSNLLKVLTSHVLLFFSRSWILATSRPGTFIRQQLLWCESWLWWFCCWIELPLMPLITFMTLIIPMMTWTDMPGTSERWSSSKRVARSSVSLTTRPRPRRWCWWWRRWWHPLLVCYFQHEHDLAKQIDARFLTLTLAL